MITGRPLTTRRPSIVLKDQRSIGAVTSGGGHPMMDYNIGHEVGLGKASSRSRCGLACSRASFIRRDSVVVGGGLNAFGILSHVDDGGGVLGADEGNVRWISPAACRHEGLIKDLRPRRRDSVMIMRLPALRKRCLGPGTSTGQFLIHLGQLRAAALCGWMTGVLVVGRVCRGQRGGHIGGIDAMYAGASWAKKCKQTQGQPVQRPQR